RRRWDSSSPWRMSYHDWRVRAGSRGKNPCDLLEHDRHGLADDQRGIAVVRRLVEVDDRKGAARAHRLARKRGRGPDLEGGPEHDEQACAAAERLGTRH